MSKRNLKKEQSDARRSEIVKASLDLFFEKGYEATTIRMIQRKIDAPIGLFYYYYKSKDQVFDAAIDLFFQSYEQRMIDIVNKGKTNSKHLLSNYINYIVEATESFREMYLNKLHWSILGAIRENTLRIMRKYIKKIIEISISNNDYSLEDKSIEIIANIIAFGVGGSILYQSKECYLKQKKEIDAYVCKVLNVKEF